MRRKIDEVNESGDFMDSNDFAVSESNFSQSFRSREAASSVKGFGGAASRQAQQKRDRVKEQLYNFEESKFSSYQKQDANDDDFWFHNSLILM